MTHVISQSVAKSKWFVEIICGYIMYISFFDSYMFDQFKV